MNFKMMRTRAQKQVKMLASILGRSAKLGARRLRIAQCVLGILSVTVQLQQLLGQPAPTDLRDAVKMLQKVTG